MLEITIENLFDSVKNHLGNWLSSINFSTSCVGAGISHPAKNTPPPTTTMTRIPIKTASNLPICIRPLTLCHSFSFTVNDIEILFCGSCRIHIFICAQDQTGDSLTCSPKCNKPIKLLSFGILTLRQMLSFEVYNICETLIYVAFRFTLWLDYGNSAA